MLVGEFLDRLKGVSDEFNLYIKCNGLNGNEDNTYSAFCNYDVVDETVIVVGTYDFDYTVGEFRELIRAMDIGHHVYVQYFNASVFNYVNVSEVVIGNDGFIILS